MKDATNYGGVGHIEIQRKTDLIRVDIHTGFPDLLIEEQSLGITQMKSGIENISGIESRKLRVILSSITQPYGEPKILAEHVASQLKK